MNYVHKLDILIRYIDNVQMIDKGSLRVRANRVIE